MSRLQEYQRQEIIAKYLSNKYTTKQLAEEYGVCLSTITRLLNRKNIPLRNSRFSFNQDYFENIDNEHKAYWLGFLYADGYVNSKKNVVSLRIKRDDDYILKQFAKDLDSNIPVKYYSHTNKLPNSDKIHTLHYASITICNKKIKEDLIKQGCLENKTLILNFPFHIPSYLYKDFIRGYMDGDGCVTYCGKQKCGNQEFKVNFCGTQEMLNGIQKVFGYNKKLGKRWDDGKNNYTLDISGNCQVYDFLTKLYNNATIYLERKYKRYLELKNIVSLPSVMKDEITT